MVKNIEISLFENIIQLCFENNFNTRIIYYISFILFEHERNLQKMICNRQAHEINYYIYGK